MGIFLLMWGVAGGLSILNNFTLAVYNWQQGDLQVLHVHCMCILRVHCMCMCTACALHAPGMQTACACACCTLRAH